MVNCPPPVAEDCAVAGDEDGNGLADCEDPACAEDVVNCPPPVAEDCAVAGDEDGNGLADCDDPACADDVVNCPPVMPEPTPGDFPSPPFESGFSIVVDGGTPSAPAGGTVVYSIPAAGDVTARLVLTTAIATCVADPTTCDGTENFVESDPNTGIPLAFGCSDGVDNDMDGMTDTEDSDCRGVQGWSVSVKTEECFNISAATTNGTAAALVIVGGLRDLQSFEKSEVVDPARNGGQTGAVSAVVLSLSNPIILPQAGVSDALVLSGNVADPMAGCLLEIVPPGTEGLRGAGEPVATAVTFAGTTIDPDILNASIGGEVGPVEDCATPGDEDGNGLADCDDAVCVGTPDCEMTPEDCAVVGDEDGNGLADCEDPVCVDTPDCMVEGPSFIRGNANDDSKVNIADPVWIIAELFRMGPATVCKSASDANDDGQVDQTDAMYLIMYNFEMGPPPPAPFADCGADGTADELGCEGAITSCPQG